MNDLELVDADELARRLSVSKRYIGIMVARRMIPVVRVARRCVRFSPPDVQKALNRYRIAAVGEAR